MLRGTTSLNGHWVYAAYDPGVMTSPKVHAALAGIGGYLTCKKADVRFAYLRDGENGATAGRVEMSVQSECALNSLPVNMSRPGVARGGFVTHRAGRLLQRANRDGKFHISAQRPPA